MNSQLIKKDAICNAQVSFRVKRTLSLLTLNNKTKVDK